MNTAVVINFIELPKISFNAQSGGLCLKWSPPSNADESGHELWDSCELKFGDRAVINFLSAVRQVELMKTL